MVDKVAPDIRSKMMAKVKGKDTKSELIVRSTLHKLGYRFRLHKKELPGNPDIVLPRFKIALFVHGCFWHQHPGCIRSRKPTSNVEFWEKKLEGNVLRDRRNDSTLKQLGWKVLVIWTCELKDSVKLIDKLRNIREQ